MESDDSCEEGKNLFKNRSKKFRRILHGAREVERMREGKGWIGSSLRNIWSPLNRFLGSKKQVSVFTLLILSRQWSFWGWRFFFASLHIFHELFLSLSYWYLPMHHGGECRGYNGHSFFFFSGKRRTEPISRDQIRSTGSRSWRTSSYFPLWWWWEVIEWGYKMQSSS